MTPRIRVLKALAFEETDIVPYHIDIAEDVAPRLAEYYGDYGAANFATHVVNHLPRYVVEPRKRWLSPDVFVDDFGCVQWVGNIWRGEEYPLKNPSLRGYTFPDLTRDEYYEGVELFLTANKDYFTTCSLAIMLDNRAWMLRGMEKFFLDLEDNPAFVEDLLDNLLDVHLRVLDRLAHYPFDSLRLADDWGGQRGVLIGAARWRQFIRPRLERIFQRGRELGFVMAVHSCGGITEIIPDLIAIGVQIINPLQPEAMNVLEVKRRYGKQVCLNGGISTQQTLPQGSVDDVRNEVAACIRLLGKGGGYIMGPAKPILPDVPLANAVALIEALVNQSPYERYRKSDDELANILSRVYGSYHA
jgi:uroporphyrinogen decarboxylase